MLEDSCLELCLFTHDSNEHIDGLQSLCEALCGCAFKTCMCAYVSLCGTKDKIVQWDSDFVFHINMNEAEGSENKEKRRSMQHNNSGDLQSFAVFWHH